MLSYWISNLVWDLIQFMIPAMIAALIVYLFQVSRCTQACRDIYIVMFMLLCVMCGS